MNSNFAEELSKAQSGDTEAAGRIMIEFLALINKYKYIDKQPDEDLLSELYLAAYMCILRFKVDPEDLKAFLESV